MKTFPLLKVIEPGYIYDKNGRCSMFCEMIRDDP